MYYDYGPVRFSVWRGLTLTVCVPLAIGVALAAINFLSQDVPIPAALRSAFGDIQDLYRDYKVPALIMHAIFFVKGLIYRRRYAAYAPQLITLGLICAFAWVAADKLGMEPQSMLSAAVPIEPQRLPTKASAKTETASTTPINVSPPHNPLAVPQTAPNLLRQARPRTTPVVTVSPDGDGTYATAGHLGQSAVVFVLNSMSAYSAAPASLLPAVVGPCPASSVLMDGQNISGCLGWVDDIDIGPIDLPRTLFFFTNSLPSGRVHLGANAIAHLASRKLSNGATQFTLASR